MIYFKREPVPIKFHLISKYVPWGTICDLKARTRQECVLERREFCLVWSFTSPVKKCSTTQNPVQVLGASCSIINDPLFYPVTWNKSRRPWQRCTVCVMREASIWSVWLGKFELLLPERPTLTARRLFGEASAWPNQQVSSREVMGNTLRPEP